MCNKEYCGECGAAKEPVLMDGGNIIYVCHECMFRKIK